MQSFDRHIERLRGPGSELVAFDAAGPSAGVWDKVLKPGRFVKAGVESVFDGETIGQMLDNWAAQKNDLWIDRGHDMDKALAYYNALVYVLKGRVVRYEPHEGAPASVTTGDLLRGRRAGWKPSDGVYAHRYQVIDPDLRSYKYASPAFSKQGKDEQGNSIGYVLYNVAATNIPFLDDVTLAMSKANEDPTMADEKHDEPDGDEKQAMEAAGAKDDDSAEDKAKKMRKYAADCGKKMRKFAEDAEEMKGRLKKFEDGPADEKKEEKAEDKKDEEKMTRRVLSSIGLPSDPEMARGKLETYQRAVDSLPALQKRLDDLLAERAAEKATERASEAQKFAKDAIGHRRWDPEHKGDPAKTEAWLVEQYTRDPDQAKGMLHAPGRFGLVRDNLRQTFTRGGDPTGAPSESRGAAQPGQGLGRELNAAAWKLVEASKAGGKPITYHQALVQAEKKNPQLVEHYEREVLAGS